MYENMTYEFILERMLARVPNKFDKREGSVIWDTHSPTAIELQILYIELDVILKEAYGDTASRQFLILRCRERGIAPYPATNAVLKGVFTPSDVDVSGQRFNIGDVNYVVTEKIADGEYQVRWETAGRVGNQFMGTMTPIEYVRGLQTAQLTEILIPGEDEEETEDLRQRYFDSFNGSAFGGNIRDYLEKTNAIPGVGRTKVTRAWNCGISPADMIPTKRVEAWYKEIRKTVDEEVGSWLDSIYRAAKEKQLTVGGTVLLTILDSEFNAASDALVYAVQEAIDPEVNAGNGMGLAPIGHVVMVQSAVAVTVSVRSSLTFDTGYGWDNLQASLEAAVSDYLFEIRKEWSDTDHLVVRISHIDTRLLSVDGVVDVQDTTVNGVDGNLILGRYEIPVFGGVSG